MSPWVMNRRRLAEDIDPALPPTLQTLLRTNLPFRVWLGANGQANPSFTCSSMIAQRFSSFASASSSNVLSWCSSRAARKRRLGRQAGEPYRAACFRHISCFSNASTLSTDIKSIEALLVLNFRKSIATPLPQGRLLPELNKNVVTHCPMQPQ